MLLLQELWSFKSFALLKQRKQPFNREVISAIQISVAKSTIILQQAFEDDLWPFSLTSKSVF